MIQKHKYAVCHALECCLGLLFLAMFKAELIRPDVCCRVHADIAAHMLLNQSSKLTQQQRLQAAEKDSLATKARADVITSMLPLIDNFERASGQIKAETEQEQKIDAAYQVRMTVQLISRL